MKQKDFYTYIIAKFTVFTIGLLLFIWAVVNVYNSQILKARLDLEKQLNNLTQKINEDLSRSVEVLHSVSSLIKIFEGLTAQEFEQFMSDMEMNKKGILILEWQPRVLAKDRENFLLMARNSGQESFRMLEPDENGVLIDAKKREEHFPILYAASTRTQAYTIGLDLSWSPERMVSKYEARDLGMPRASNTFDITLSKGEHRFPKGIAVTLPVYNTRSIPKSLSERRIQLKGYLAAVLFLDDFVSTLKSEGEFRDLGFRITDLTQQSIIGQDIHHTSYQLTESSTINIFGQKWNVEIFASNEFMNNYLDLTYFLLPFSFLLFIFLLLYLLFLFEKKNEVLSKTRVRLQKALHASESAAKSKMLFLANMSHEIRTPMNAILGYSKLIESEDDQNKRQSHIDRMSFCGNHLLNIIDDILTVSSLEESKLTLHRSLFNLNDLIDEVNTLVNQFNKTNSVDYSFEIDNPIGFLYGDSSRLRQILLNLLSNAFKFTYVGSIVLGCKVVSDSNQNEIRVQFIVKDTGIGMEEKYLTHAYSPFTQEDESFSRKKSGTGLGLSIVYGLVKSMNGDIDIQSTKDIGTTFTIDLPFLKSLPVIIENTPKMKVEESKRLNLKKKKSILIAEDDVDARYLISVYLGNINLDLDFVTNGKELLSQYSKKQYDIILTDIQMPELDGLSATKQLRDLGANIPILALSAHVLDEEKVKILDAGVSEILSKPFTKEGLISFIKPYYL